MNIYNNKIIIIQNRKQMQQTNQPIIYNTSSYNNNNNSNSNNNYQHQHQYIPDQAFLLQPGKDEYYVGTADGNGISKNFRRFLFEAMAKETYTDYERRKYREFADYLEKNWDRLPKNIKDNPFWNEQWKMRWLTSEQYQPKNAVKAMDMYTKYLDTNRFQVTPNAEKYLKTGVFYVSGRDAYYRPILVFDIDKMIKSKMKEQQLIESQKFFFEKVMNEYLLPGQVETWVAIIDVGYQNLMSLVSSMKASIGFLSNTFRNRMRICYVVRIPGSLSFIWRIIKNFLHQDTAEKINFLDDQAVTPLLKYANPSQLQIKYGGTQPQINQFWPPRNIKRLKQLNLLNYSHPDIKTTLLTPQQYLTKYQKNELLGQKISHSVFPKIHALHPPHSPRSHPHPSQVSSHDPSFLPLSTPKNKQIHGFSLGHPQSQKFMITPIKIDNHEIQVGKTQGNLKQNQKEALWPVQYVPLKSPHASIGDAINWEKLLI